MPTSPAPSDPSLPITRFTLDNGLGVILHHDPTLPLAAINLAYGVGSKDEITGRSGFAHLFEHLMFMGTERVPEGEFDRLMENGGGSNNAGTSSDRTVYYSSGPAALLPTLLWLEADRLERLGPAMTQEKLDLQREVVRNERRESYENRPYGKTWLTLPELLYPAGHPYHHPIIGSHEDIQAATVDDVRSFFSEWYRPANASLCIAGDFDPAATRTLVEELFGDLESGGPFPHRMDPAQPLLAERRGVLEDDVPAPRTVMAWITPAHFAPGDADLDLAASLLAEGASSRLQQALIHRRELVQSVSADQSSLDLGSLFVIAATALPGVDIEEVEAAIEDEMSALLRDGPEPQELARCVSLAELEFLRGLQGLGERAELLNQYARALGNPDALAHDLARYRAITTQSLADAMRRHLAPNRKAVLRILPRGSARKPVSSGARDRAPATLPEQPWQPPLPETRRPARWHLERDAVPLVSVRLKLPKGAGDDPSGEEGRASVLAEMLSEGSEERDAASLARALDLLGSEFGVSADRTHTNLVINALADRLPKTLDLVREVIERPRLREEDWQRIRGIRLAGIRQRRSNPAATAAVVANRFLHAELPGWSHPIAGDEDTIASLHLDSLRQAHQSLRAALPAAVRVSAGPLAALKAIEDFEDALGLGGAVTEAEEAPISDAAGLRLVLVDRPDAPQTALRFVRRAPPLRDPGAPSLWLANGIFGGSFTSRLNQNLRERHGFTYGATSGLYQGQRHGVFVAASSVHRESTAAALREMRNEFERLTPGDFEADELERALASEHSAALKEFEDVAGATGILSPFLAAGFGPEGLRDCFARLAEVELDEVMEAARRWMTLDAGVLVLVGDLAAFDKDLPDGFPEALRVDEDGRPLS